MLKEAYSKKLSKICACLSFSYKSSSEEETVLIHVELASHLQDFGTHLEAEEKLMGLKQTAACVPAENKALT